MIVNIIRFSFWFFYGLVSEIKMNKHIAMFMLFVFSGCSMNSRLEKPTGNNCDLVTPPINAGEIISEGVFFKVYPRNNEINNTYNGCQTLWVESDGWILYTISEIINGDIARLWSTNMKDPEEFLCSYANGELVKGNSSKCPTPQEVSLKTLKPGCVKRLNTTYVADSECIYQ